MARSVGTFSESGGLGRGIGASISGKSTAKPAKATTAKTTAKKTTSKKLPKMTMEEQSRIFDLNKSIEIAQRGGDDVMANYYKDIRKTFIDSIKNSQKKK